MPSENDSNDDFEDSGVFNGKSIKKLREEIDVIFKEVKGGKLQGTWETKEIDEPGVKGWISMGEFGFDDALEPLDPLRPQRRRPMPETPFELPKTASEEASEPLTDVFECENAITVYVELPGEEKDDIQLKVKGGNLYVRAGSFHRRISLPNDDIATERMTSEYKNGVLKMTLPRKMTLRDEDVKKQEEV